MQGSISTEHEAIKCGLQLFQKHLSENEWEKRRNKIIAKLKQLSNNRDFLNKNTAIRVQEDESAWYMFLAEQALNEPYVTDTSQSQRILPFWASIGARASYANKVIGLDEKVKDALFKYKAEPDGTIFEICVALAYAEIGWIVEFIPEESKKTPDMRISFDNHEFYVECKRFNRVTDYSQQERNDFLTIWQEAVGVIIKNSQCIWLNCKFYEEISSLPKSFLADILRSKLPVSKEKETLLHNSSSAIINARLIDINHVNAYLNKNYVKWNSPFLTHLLGKEWAPENASVTTLLGVTCTSEIQNCDIPILGTFIDQVNFAAGITREFLSPQSIEKKAKEINTKIKEAIKQIPLNKQGVVHIMAETLEGAEVERRRSEKLEGLTIKTGKSIISAQLHRVQCHQRVNMSFEIDETVTSIPIEGDSSSILKNLPLPLPSQVIIPRTQDAVYHKGEHWNIYK